MGRNVDTAAFTEVTYANAERPGVWVNDPLDPTGRRFEPAVLNLGPGHRLWLRGLETEQGYTTPTMNVRQPTDPAAFTATADYLVYTAYREARQLHALIAKDATASGESRRQAAADFVGSLGSTARAVEGLCRWLLTVTHRLAYALTGGVAPSNVRAVVRCQIGGVTPTVEEIREAREGVAAGLLDRSTYQSRAGVDDPEAEDSMIEGRTDGNTERAE
jgi:hypothetical protein